jgi:hypothetical protein
MAPGTSGQERFMPGRDAAGPSSQPIADDAALAAALARHELALARLRLELPSPSDGAFRELEAAERALKAILAQRDRAPR